MKLQRNDISDYKIKFFEEGKRQGASEDYIDFNRLRELFSNIESGSHSELVEEFMKGFNSIKKG